MQSEELTGRYDVVPVILCQKFNCRSRIGTMLDLIQKNERIAFNKFYIRYLQRHPLINFIGRKVTFEDISKFRMLIKIDDNNAVIIIFPELFYNERFADLASPLYKKALVSFSPFPFNEI